MDSMFLYDGFRPYVPKQKLADFDKAFHGRSTYTVSFMTDLIHQFVNLKYYAKLPKFREDGYLFNFFLLEFSQRNSKRVKAFRDFNKTPRNVDSSFLFSNP
ncbi:hypothetical protein SAMN03097699_2608 [Flavobacteriaceae bacterium MAR_2010_188]|nr:hypothetical protein SAMN03097699_2608 [Flavobacteriaceae bacterium MAR_2010_188]